MINEVLHLIRLLCSQLPLKGEGLKGKICVGEYRINFREEELHKYTEEINLCSTEILI